MDQKSAFVLNLENRIKSFAVRVINLGEGFPTSQSTRVINYQLIKSATSTGANHRAAGRARSRAEFHSKLSITMEEADETIYWLEIIKAAEIKCNQQELDFLITESKEISSIIAKARHTSKYGPRK